MGCSDFPPIGPLVPIPAPTVPDLRLSRRLGSGASSGVCVMAGQFSVRFRAFDTGRRVVAVAGAAALVRAGTAPVADAASVSTATISGGSGTATVGGTLYAKQGGALTIDLTTDTSQCVEVVHAGGTAV